MLDLDPVMKRIEEACGRYEKTAPTVCDYLNGLYVRINEDATAVRLAELMFVGRLVEDGTWMHPNYAANAVYHLMDRIGMDTTGQAGF